jgi:hypothetical protein
MPMTNPVPMSTLELIDKAFGDPAVYTPASPEYNWVAYIWVNLRRNGMVRAAGDPIAFLRAWIDSVEGSLPGGDAASVREENVKLRTDLAVAQKRLNRIEENVKAAAAKPGAPTGYFLNLLK